MSVARRERGVGAAVFAAHDEQEPRMSDPKPAASEDLDQRIDRIEDQAEDMERPDREIPLSDDQDEEGVGPVTGLVP
jgi:hypothetical protein